MAPRILRACVLATVAFGAAGGATAQSPEFSEPSVVFPDATYEEPIEPETSQAVVPLWADVGCNEGDAVAAGGVAGLPTTIKWNEAENRTFTPDEASVALEKIRDNVFYDTTRCAQEPDYFFRFYNNATILVTRQALAFATHTAPLVLLVEKPAASSSGGTQDEFGPYVANLSFQAGYRPAFEARPDIYNQQVTQGAPYRFEITVINHGNGPTRFHPEIVDPAPALNVSSPPDLILTDSVVLREGTGSEGRIIIDGQWLGSPASSATINLTIVASHADRPLDGPTETLALELSVIGLRSLAPGPDVVLLALAVAGAVLLGSVRGARRARKR